MFYRSVSARFGGFRHRNHLRFEPGLGENEVNQEARHEAVKGGGLQVRFDVIGDRQEGQMPTKKPTAQAP